MMTRQYTPLPAVFLDRDGTINQDVNFLSRPEQVELIPGAGGAIAKLNRAGFKVVVITNQSGVARGLFSEADLELIQAELSRQLAEFGARVDAFYACPHLPPPNGKLPKYTMVCDCRKPKPGLILRAAEQMGLDLGQSYMVGDVLRDIEAGNAAGVVSIMVETGLQAPPPSSQEETPDHVVRDLAAAADLILARSGEEPQLVEVLIVKMSALGDVVQSLPVAMAIKDQFPRAKVDWLVEKPSAGLLLGHPALDRVLVSPRHDIAQDKSKIFQSVGDFLPRLRARRYQAVLDLQGLMKSAIFVALSRGGQKIGFAGGKEPLAAWPLSKRLPAYDPDRPALERYLDLLEPLGVMRPAKPRFGLAPTSEELDRVGRLLGPEQNPRVVLHPMAKWESKLWPLEHWVKLAEGLLERGRRLLLTGSASDREITGAIRQKAGGGEDILDLAGRTNLRELAALLSLSPVVVCTDTGVMHLASAMGARVAALFGPTAPWRTGPYGSGHRVLRLGLECSPCFRRQCPEPRCLTELEPGKVIEAVTELWRERE